MWTESNQFLQGVFAPLRNEIVVENVHVEGQIPLPLRGTLYRIGSNQMLRPADPDRFHWFDGDGMVHAFHIADGRASYRNRWVQTDGLRLERAVGRSLYNGIYGHAGVAQPPLPPGAPAIKTVADVHVLGYAGRVLALHEADTFYWILDPRTLETLGKFSFGGQPEGLLTAHPHRDARTGEMLFYALDGEARRLTCFGADDQGQVLWQHTVALPMAPFVHDFIFTEHHLVFVMGPLRWRPYAPDRVRAGRSSMFFDGEGGARVLLIERGSGRARWFDTGPFVADHYLNAYEDAGQVVVDLTLTRVLRHDPDIPVEAYFPFPLGPGPSPFSGPELHRMTITVETGEVALTRIGDFAAEFVRANDAVLGRPHRYGYMAARDAASGPGGFNGLVKHDYQTGRSAVQRVARSHEMTPGEPVFVARPGAVDEDDGWVLAVWWDPQRQASELVIQDAQRFEAPPLARLQLDHRVPPGFHGDWVAQA